MKPHRLGIETARKPLAPNPYPSETLLHDFYEIDAAKRDLHIALENELVIPVGEFILCWTGLGLLLDWWMRRCKARR